jgi:subtilase family serine protease
MDMKRLFLGALAAAASALPAPSSALQVLTGHLRPEFTSLPVLGHVPQDQVLDLALGLPLRNKAALDALNQDLYNPQSPNFRKFLTPQQFRDQFGPTEADYQRVADFALSHHLIVTRRHSNRLILDVRGTVAQVESAFHLHLLQHSRRDQSLFFAPDAEPSIDTPLALDHVAGLDTFMRKRSHFKRRSASTLASHAAGSLVKPHGGTGGGHYVSYMGQDFRDAYCAGMPVALNGSGQSIGLVEFNGYYPSDISAYENDSTPPLPSTVPTVVPVDGFFTTPHSTYSGDNVADDVLEVSLDIEIAISVAPGASIVVFETSGSGEAPADDMMNDIATRTPLCNQISSSWNGWGDSTTTSILAQYQAQGQAYFSASGDNGAMDVNDYAGPVGEPDSMSPYITEVGGTDLFTNNPGLPESFPITYNSETTWNDSTGASGGGICNDNDPNNPNYPSQQLPLPSYQNGIPNLTITAGGSLSWRNIPDVSAVAVNFVVIDNLEGNSYALWDYGTDGTSGATPLWAAFLALTNQQAASLGQGPVGFANPALYTLGKGGSYASTFNDIADGSNNRVPSVDGPGSTVGGGNPNDPVYYNAVAGYDLCTGWGSPKGLALINALYCCVPTLSPTPSITQTFTYSPTLTVTSTFTYSPTVTPTPTITQTFTYSPTSTITPTHTPTPIYANSTLGKSVLGPVPATQGRPVCLYSLKQPSSSNWTIYDAVGEKVATLDFGTEYAQCWDPHASASGIYFVRVDSVFVDGSRETIWQKVIVIK